VDELHKNVPPWRRGKSLDRGTTSVVANEFLGWMDMQDKKMPHDMTSQSLEILNTQSSSMMKPPLGMHPRSMPAI